MVLSSRRAVYVISLLLVSVILSMAYRIEYVENITPCPLCLLQRIALLSVGVLLLLAVLHNPQKIANRIYSTLIFLVSITGMAIAGRQIWLQSLPADQAPTTCGVSLSYLLQALPLGDAIQHIFRGTAECAEISWTFLGLGMATWSLIVLSFFAFVAVWQFSLSFGENTPV